MIKYHVHISWCVRQDAPSSGGHWAVFFTVEAAYGSADKSAT
ncbi:MAG: hypothetical protein QME66_10285 [Candidatus Eisenbacteria bacterium]|nr:hypothetical protein [Candidatus Eisenbacteria bacterium]